LATTGGPLILASSPHARRGVLWDVFRRHYGPDGDPLILVAHGASRTLNPSLPQRVVDRALEKDRARATAEYLAEFRSDLEAFVSLEVVEACVGSYYEMAPSATTIYYGYVDPSGGARDSFAIAVAHRDRDGVVVDCIRETRPPFLPEQVIAECAVLLKSYRCTKVVGDRYAGEFPREQFQKRGIRYEVSTKTKSEIYVDFLPMLNSGGVMLPRSDRLVAQLASLERTTARGTGKDSIDHPRDQHDDLANAIAGAATLARSHGGYFEALVRACRDDDAPDEPTWADKERQRRYDELMRRYGQPVRGY
jgi:hypothetical protein